MIRENMGLYVVDISPQIKLNPWFHHLKTVRPEGETKEGKKKSNHLLNTYFVLGPEQRCVCVCKTYDNIILTTYYVHYHIY